MTAGRATELIKQRARELGFHAVGITDLAATAHSDALTEWLSQGMAGRMTYMHRQAAKRGHPSKILPGATRAIVVLRYYDATEPKPPQGPPTGRVARYARGPDYHQTLAPGLETLAALVRELGGPETIARTFVDAGPVPERELAQRAGLGWIGKNTMLIQPGAGSFSFIGSVLTNLNLEIDRPFEFDRCGSCRRCLDACPTDAFVDERRLDARRCISYLTIEHKGEWDPDLAPLTGNWVFGCDVCQEVCPWNVRFAETVPNPISADPELARLDLDALASLSDHDFATRFGDTALARPGATGMRRNAQAARKNLAGAAGRQPHSEVG